MPKHNANKSLTQALTQLHDQRVRIEGAIAKLEGALGQTEAKTRSARQERVPVVVIGSRVARALVMFKQRSRAGWTPEARAAAADRMRNYWANEGKVKSKKPRAKKASKRAEQSQTAQGPRRSTNGWTDTARSAVGERMRKYWAERRAEKIVTG